MKELLKRRTELKNRISILDWDQKRNQLHFAKKIKLDEYKKEVEEINQKLENDINEKQV